jgi:hypothetical protein
VNSSLLAISVEALLEARSDIIDMYVVVACILATIETNHLSLIDVKNSLFGAISVYLLSPSSRVATWNH